MVLLGYIRAISCPWDVSTPCSNCVQGGIFVCGSEPRYQIVDVTYSLTFFTNIVLRVPPKLGVDMRLDRCSDRCLDVYLDMCLDVYLGMCLDMYLGMCLDMYLGICLNMYFDMCLDMYFDMCLDMYFDMILDMC